MKQLALTLLKKNEMLGMLNYLQISIEYEEAIEEGLDNEMLYLILV